MAAYLSTVNSAHTALNLLEGQTSWVLQSTSSLKCRAPMPGYGILLEPEYGCQMGSPPPFLQSCGCDMVLSVDAGRVAEAPLQRKFWGAVYRGVVLLLIDCLILKRGGHGHTCCSQSFGVNKPWQRLLSCILPVIRQGNIRVIRGGCRSCWVCSVWHSALLQPMGEHAHRVSYTIFRYSSYVGFCILQPLRPPPTKFYRGSLPCCCEGFSGITGPWVSSACLPAQFICHTPIFIEGSFWASGPSVAN